MSAGKRYRCGDVPILRWGCLYPPWVSLMLPIYNALQTRWMDHGHEGISSAGGVGGAGGYMHIGGFGSAVSNFSFN